MPPPPICFVERAPIAGSPAASAGLKAGDAILRFGEAADFRQVADVVRPNVRLSLQVLGKDGVITERTVVPRPFDPKKPNSLLGCMMSDTCPAKFVPHPALRGHEQWLPQTELLTLTAPNQHKAPLVPHSGVPDSVKFLHQRQERWDDDDASSEIPWDDIESVAPSAYEAPSVVMLPPADACIAAARADSIAAAQSTAGTRELQPSGQGPRRGPRTMMAPCAAGAASDAPVFVGFATSKKEQQDSSNCGASSRLVVHYYPGCSRFCSESTSRPLWRSRLALATASLLNLIHGCVFLAAPALGGAARASEVANAFKGDLIMLATTGCESLEADGAHRLLEDAADDHEPSGGAGLTLSSFVWVALTVAGLQIVLTFAGLWLAVTPNSGACTDCTQRSNVLLCCQRLRFFLEIFYPPVALLLWLLLAAVTMYCVTFRREADALLRSYWECLGSVSEAAASVAFADKAAPYFHSMLVATAVCAGADLSAVFGLFAACSLIGWRSVLRTSVMSFAAISTMGGLLIATIGGWALQSDSADLLAATVSKLLLGLGTATFLTGVLGLVAAKGERKVLLQLYAILLVVCSLALTALITVLLTVDVGDLEPWLVRLSQLANGQLDEDDGTTGIAADDGMFPDIAEVDEVVGLLDEHRLGLSAVAVLALFLLVMNVTMACSLRYLIGSPVAKTAVGPGYEGLDVASEESDDQSEDEEEDDDGKSETQWEQGARRNGVSEGLDIDNDDADDDEDKDNDDDDGNDDDVNDNETTDGNDAEVDDDDDVGEAEDEDDEDYEDDEKAEQARRATIKMSKQQRQPLQRARRASVTEPIHFLRQAPMPTSGSSELSRLRRLASPDMDGAVKTRV